MVKTRAQKKTLGKKIYKRLKNSPCRGKGPAVCRSLKGCKYASSKKRNYCRKSKNRSLKLNNSNSILKAKGRRGLIGSLALASVASSAARQTKTSGQQGIQTLVSHNPMSEYSVNPNMNSHVHGSNPGDWGTSGNNGRKKSLSTIPEIRNPHKPMSLTPVPDWKRQYGEPVKRRVAGADPGTHSQQLKKSAEKRAENRAKRKAERKQRSELLRIQKEKQKQQSSSWFGW